MTKFKSIADAVLYLRAVLAALDEGLQQSPGSKGPVLASSIRPDLDLPAVLRDMELELSQLSASRDELRNQAVIEQRQAFDWARRRQVSEAEGREDLSAQAAVRQAEHQREANTLNVEWDEYSALVNEYSELVDALRKRITPAVEE